MKRTSHIISVILTLIIVISGLSGAFSVSAAEGEWKCKLGINNIEDGQFKFQGYKTEDGTFHDLETEARKTWDEAWPGHYIVGENMYAVSKSEGGGKVDMMSVGAWGSAVLFTVPADGVYDFEVSLKKLWGEDGNGATYLNLSLRKGDGTVLDEEKGVLQGDYMLTATDVELSEGETVFALVEYDTKLSTKSSGQNCALNSFNVYDVTFLTTEAPETDASTPEVDKKPLETDAEGEKTEENDNAVVIAIAVGAAALAVAAVITVIVIKKKKK